MSYVVVVASRAAMLKTDEHGRDCIMSRNMRQILSNCPWRTSPLALASGRDRGEPVFGAAIADAVPELAGAILQGRGTRDRSHAQEAPLPSMARTHPLRERRGWLRASISDGGSGSRHGPVFGEPEWPYVLSCFGSPRYVIRTCDSLGLPCCLRTMAASRCNRSSIDSGGSGTRPAITSLAAGQ